MSGTTTIISISDLCNQRKKQMMFPNTLFRFTPKSPYGGDFSKFQLDMKRKTEILKYSNNTSSTKTNNLTKAQKYASIAKGYAQRQPYADQTITIKDSTGNYSTITVTYPDKLIVNTALSTDTHAVQILGQTGYYTISVLQDGYLVKCNNVPPTPTSSCGIPGPIINLFDDPNVPVYNLLNNSINNASYSESIVEDTSPWQVLPNYNILLSDVSTRLGSILITRFIDLPTKVFTLNIPIGVYKTTLSQNEVAHVNIKTIKLDVYYNNNLITNNNYTVSLLKNALNTIINVNYNNLQTNKNGYNYFGILDTVVISGLQLSTQPGYIYDFYLTIVTDNATTNTTIFANYSNSMIESKLTVSA
jgi:hypothetical protein